MRKIPTLFKRDPATNLRYVRDEPHRDCLWVLAGEGVATRKYDGTCCLVRDGRLFRRHELKPNKTAPANFEPVQVDELTGKTVGWVPVGDGPEDRWHREAFHGDERDGTYELLGPKIQGNPEQIHVHTLLPHRLAQELLYVPRDFAGLRDYLTGAFPYEGVVWRHPDGRMAKLKKRDFPQGK